MTGSVLFRAVGITKHFAVQHGLGPRSIVKAVDGVSFDIAAGETLGLVGESGCGKSTLGRVLVRLMRPTAGRIEYNGQDIGGLARRGLRELRRDIQLIFQDPYASLNPRMTVRQILIEPLRNFRIATGAEAERRVRDMLDLCGLGSGVADRLPREFSGGQRQRIGIARALIVRPKIIVADEPISALDVSIQAQIINLLQDLQAEFNLTYLFIAHDLSMVRHISDRVAVMYLGRIVEIADTNTLYEFPAHPYTRILLSSIPFTDPDAEALRRPIALFGEISSPLALPSGCHFHPRCPWAEPSRCPHDPPALQPLSATHRAACHYAGRLSLRELL